MLDNKLIEIMKIHKLKLIYCYVIDSKDYDNLDKCLAIEIVYDDKKKLSLNYKDEYFFYFLNRIKSIYEKNKRDITFLDDFSKEVIEKYSIKENKLDTNYTDKNIYPFNNVTFKLGLYKSYIIQALKSVLRVFHENKDISIVSLTGYKSKYVATYKVDNEKHIASLLCNNNSNDILFKIGGINNLGFVIDGNIKINNNYTLTKWNFKNENINGKIYSDIDNNFIEEEINYNSVAVYYNRVNNNELSNDFRNLLANVKEVIDIKYDRCIKTNDNSYLLKKEIDNGRTKNYYYYHLIITDNIINIMYENKSGYMAYDNTLFVPTVIDKKEYIVATLSEDEKLVQERNLNSNKYKYVILKNGNTDEIDISNYDSLDEINNREVGYGLSRRI